ncbi:hypothetical protein [Burkholderia cepacia]|uniref:hypothetical protein n=1 Tax=Burkholderia cepacia TaxID=292 RepID=UPI002AB768C7|nr:hypothetical protein [Burkholderia cepacia]
MILYLVATLGPGLISATAVRMFFVCTLVMPLVGTLIQPQSMRPTKISRRAEAGESFPALLCAVLKNWMIYIVWPIAVGRAGYREVRYHNGARKALNLYFVAFLQVFIFLAIAMVIPQDIRSQAVLILAMYLAIGMAALTLAKVQLFPPSDATAEHFLTALLYSSERIRDVIVWPYVLIRSVQQHGKE